MTVKFRGHYFLKFKLFSVNPTDGLNSELYLAFPLFMTRRADVWLADVEEGIRKEPTMMGPSFIWVVLCSIVVFGADDNIS